MTKAEKRLERYFLEYLKNDIPIGEYATSSQCIKDIEKVLNMLEKARKYSKENIEVCENRINSPFCNLEKASKELMIHKNYLEILRR